MSDATRSRSGER